MMDATSQKSSHYIVGYDIGQVAKMVDLNKMAWHARSYNEWWLGIEVAQPLSTDEYSDWEYSTTAYLVQQLLELFALSRDRSHVKGHDEIPPGIADGKTDPGPLWDWDRFMQLLT